MFEHNLHIHVFWINVKFDNKVECICGEISNIVLSCPINTYILSIEKYKKCVFFMYSIESPVRWIHNVYVQCTCNNLNFIDLLFFSWVFVGISSCYKHLRLKLLQICMNFPNFDSFYIQNRVWWCLLLVWLFCLYRCVTFTKLCSVYITFFA